MRESINYRVAKRFSFLRRKSASTKQIHKQINVQRRISILTVLVLLLSTTCTSLFPSEKAVAKAVPGNCLQNQLSAQRYRVAKTASGTYLSNGIGNQTTEFSEEKDKDSGGLAIRQTGFEVIILSSYKKTMKIGDTSIIVAVSSGGTEISWKSSSSKIASVDPYGVITARKSGTCQIIAKTRGAEAKCTVVVEPTRITLNTKTASIENGATFQMRATTSNNSSVTWKSSKQSVAIISDSGLIQALKPGTSVITATADGAKETCMLTVMKPSIKLSADAINLYRNQVALLKATVSSNREVTWTSSRPSVATVNEYGQVTAVKHGEARIKATLDGVSRYCVVTVKPPEIRLDKTSLTLKKGQSYSLKVTVSSGATPVFSCNSKRVASVNAYGEIQAKAKGSCTVSVSEDGTTVKCKITVTE